MDEARNANAADTAAAPPIERRAIGVDVAARPDSSWLDQVEGEINDVDLVLKCLSRDTVTICQTCDAVRAQGQLQGRPVLARCADSKQAR